MEEKRCWEDPDYECLDSRNDEFRDCNYCKQCSNALRGENLADE
jgi:hypothetical protein